MSTTISNSGYNSTMGASPFCVYEGPTSVLSGSEYAAQMVLNQIPKHVEFFNTYTTHNECKFGDSSEETVPEKQLGTVDNFLQDYSNCQMQSQEGHAG